MFKLVEETVLEEQCFISLSCMYYRTVLVFHIIHTSVSVFFKLNCFGRHRRRTAPQNGGSRSELVRLPMHSRVNGWSLPLHSFQLIAWLMYSFMAIVGFGIYIPLLPAPWSFAAYGVSFTNNPHIKNGKFSSKQLYLIFSSYTRFN